MRELKSVVFNEDCLIGLSSFPDKFFDFGMLDPPFGSSIMAKNKKQRHRTTDSGYRNKEIPHPEWFAEIDRVCSRYIIWGAQYMLPYLRPGGSFVVWDKKADPTLHNMSSCDVGWINERHRIRTFRGAWCGAVKCEIERTIHIHQKPVSLYRWLLHHYAKPGDKILDTHMGSQSSRIAAFSMGFDFWGWEIEPKYFESGNSRFKERTRQLEIKF